MKNPIIKTVDGLRVAGSDVSDEAGGCLASYRVRHGNGRLR